MTSDNISPLSDYLLIIPFISTLLLFYSPSNVSIYNILLYIIPAYFLADLLSGIYHIASDNYFGKIEPMFTIAEGSREHHKNPGAMIHSPYKEHFKEAIFNNIPLYLLIFVISSYYSRLALFLLMIANFSNFGQLSHKFSHMRSHHVSLPYGVQTLQNWRILLHPSVHNLHHNGYNSNFAVLNGSSSFITNSLFIFLHKNYKWFIPFGFDFSESH